MKAVNLELVAAKAMLGLLLPEDLQGAAVDALEEGCDSPSLRILAGLTKAEVGEARQLFDRLLAELHVPKTSRRGAVERLARESAKEILSRKIWLSSNRSGWISPHLLPAAHRRARPAGSKHSEMMRL